MDTFFIAIAVIAVIIFLIFGFVCFWGAPYVPSIEREIRGALSELYKIKKSDHLVDLGSGDGVVLKIASELGAKAATGVELNFLLVLLSRFRLRKFKDAKVYWDNITKRPLPDDCTIVYLFCVDRDFKRYLDFLRKEQKRIGRPIYLISLAFKAPGLKPVKTWRAYFLYKIG